MAEAIFLLSLLLAFAIIVLSCLAGDLSTLRKDAIRKGHAEYDENNDWKWK